MGTSAYQGQDIFASWTDNSSILLHYFVKKTQKTPKQEIDQAKRNLKDIQERSKSNENMEKY